MVAGKFASFRPVIHECRRECVELASRVLGASSKVRVHETNDGYYVAALEFYGGTVTVATPETDCEKGAWEDGRDFLRDMEKRFLAAQSGSLAAESAGKLAALVKGLNELERARGVGSAVLGDYVLFSDIAKLLEGI